MNSIQWRQIVNAVKDDERQDIYAGMVLLRIGVNGESTANVVKESFVWDEWGNIVITFVDKNHCSIIIPFSGFN